MSSLNNTGLRVIVCGLPRTGTTSIKLALEQLGYRNVYHMSSFIKHTEDSEHWEYIIKAKIAGQEIPRSVWDSLLDGYEAAIDAPACYFATDLARAYPDAKVVILNRQEGKWYDSFAATVQRMIKRRESLECVEWILRPWLPTQLSAIIRVGNLLSKSGIGLGSYGKTRCLEFFRWYYADCRANIAAERRIEFRVQDGWAPLCGHLGVQIPVERTADGIIQTKFPRANDKNSFHSWVSGIKYSMLKQAGMSILFHGTTLLGFLLLFRHATNYF